MATNDCAEDDGRIGFRTFDDGSNEDSETVEMGVDLDDSGPADAHALHSMKHIAGSLVEEKYTEDAIESAVNDFAKGDSFFSNIVVEVLYNLNENLGDIEFVDQTFGWSEDDIGDDAYSTALTKAQIWLQMAVVCNDGPEIILTHINDSDTYSVNDPFADVVDLYANDEIVAEDIFADL